MTDDIVDQLVALKAPPDVIEAARDRAQARRGGAAAANDTFDVWPENWTSVQLFLNVSTQWDVVAGMSGLIYMGLKYEIVPEQMDRLRIARKKRADMWGDLSLMERAALPLLNKKAP
ncbi:DUF1799 domain-containing protein [Massilia sp. RP-1-19]|uniref:DUF1799 domain-containing protein n=1 Tax=Massilia polaris TaxID=2728846 RepID=A0A848HQ56_9BURK|nr:DUF1799 domain-containing protein [Massilia polaris]NML62270.1 DUF1799 domain-containing protein [Massilia polaris]